MGLVGLGWVAVAYASDSEAHLTAHNQVVVDLQHDRAAEDAAEVWTRLHATGAGRTQAGRWFFEVDVDHAVLIGNERGGGDVEAAANVWVGESGWAGTLGPMYLRAGVLVERWGVLDLLPVSDVLNGMDLRAGPLTPVDHLRVPAPMAQLEVGRDRLRAALTVLPFGARSRLPVWGTDWSVLRQGMVEGLVADVATWEGDALTTPLLQEGFATFGQQVATLDAQTRRGLESALAVNGTPRPLWEAAEVGAEVKAALGPVDWTLNGAWIRSRSPQTAMQDALRTQIQSRTLPGIDDSDAILASIGAAPLSATWPRMWTVGATAATVVGPFGVRAEGGYQDGVVVQLPWLRSVQSRWMAGGLGVDWSYGTRWTLVSEARFRRILDVNEAALMVGIPHHIDVAAGLRVSLAQERLWVESGGIWDATFGEWMARPSARWRFGDHFEAGVGALLLGSTAAPAQTWDDAMTYNGGPIGYYSDNDAVWFDLRWML